MHPLQPCDGATVRVKAQRCHSTTLTLRPGNGRDGGAARITITTADGCGWTASPSEAWIRVLTPTGTGNGTIIIELAPNPSDVRNAFVTIAGQQVSVRQRRRG